MAALTALDVVDLIPSLNLKETKDLFFHLEVQLKDLDDIERCYVGNDCKQHYVQKWLDIEPNASVEKLVDGIKKIDKITLAKIIKSKYLSPATPSQPTNTSTPGTATNCMIIVIGSSVLISA